MSSSRPPHLARRLLQQPRLAGKRPRVGIRRWLPRNWRPAGRAVAEAVMDKEATRNRERVRGWNTQAVAIGGFA